MIDREYTLNRLKSRSITPQEFNYEILSAPPILSMFTAEDIQQLNYIATSVKYSAKLKEKYEAIDEIMNRRGFDKLVSGTNRVAYQPRFANNFIVKVAYDSVALKDSIREYRNQFLIKPFCTKVFEVSPCGTLGVFEKVNPITNRKEYISMAADIYKLLSEFIIGQYIIDDIGTEYFNNIGFRNGFGAVVLDFPYVYEVDGKKIWCNKPNHNDPTGYCNGPIDYDLGFNKLICKRCGAVYKPFELAKKIEYNNESQYISESEETNMRIFVSGGSKNLKKQEIATGDFRNPINAIKSNKMNKKVEKQLKEEKALTVNGVAAPKEEPEETEEEVPVKEPKVEEEVKEEEPKKEVKAAFSINKDDIGKGDLGYEVEDDEDDIEDLLAKINNMYYYSDTDDEKRAEIAETCCKLLSDIFNDNIEVVVTMITTLFKKMKNREAVIKDFADKNCNTINNLLVKILLASDKIDFVTNITGYEFDEENNNLVFNFETNINENTSKSKATLATNELGAAVDIDTIANFINKFQPEEPSDISDETLVEEDDVEPTGIDLAKAVVVSKKDLFPDEELGKVITVKNDDGSFLVLDDKILAIEYVDDRKLDDIAIVAKDWYEEAVEKINSIKEAPVGVMPASEEEEEVVEEEESGEEE